MSSTTNERQKSQSPLQVAIASLVGTTLEWFDFLVYGTMAALVFPKLFFPSLDPTAGTLASFAGLAVGFLARPIGGVIFGHYGDKVGRKTMLVITLMMMGISTFAMGLIPTYQQIGIWAPIILIVLRLVQGLALGGEWGGAALMAVEHAPAGKRGRYGSTCQMGSAAGLLLSTFVIGLVSTLPDEQFLSWGWRLPFLGSVVLFGFGLIIRLKLVESHVFQDMKKEEAIVKVPIIELFRTQPKNIFIAAGIGAMNNITFYTVATFTIAYTTTQLGMDRQPMLTNIMIASVFFFFAMLFWGFVSDHVGRRPLVKLSMVGTAIGAIFYFQIIHTENLTYIMFAMIGMLFAQTASYGPQAAFFSELFNPQVRYTGASLGTNIATALFGGTAPLVATALMAHFGSPTPFAIYMVIIACIGFTAVSLTRETVTAEIGLNKHK
ncbi:MAG: MHS family MFS transporter [Candidatus Adiutrix sp.]|jgi:metabolite-proton symporter|nr:MHS family MFS transporter [Candidatus Adiutrix sp.]